MDSHKIYAITEDLQLPFEFFSIDVIESRLEKLKKEQNIIRNFYRIEDATKSEIRKRKFDESENVRFFLILNFFKFLV